MGTRDKFLAQRGSVSPERIDVSELGEGETMLLHPLGTASRLEWGKVNDKAMETDDYTGPDPTAYLVVKSAVEDDGTPSFELQDCEWLSSDEFPGGFLNRIAEKVLEISGIGGDAKKAEKVAADAEGDSSGSASSDTPSSSPSDSGEPSPS